MPRRKLHIAFISDLHYAESQEALDEFRLLWSQVLAEQPKIILLGGDYVDNQNNMVDLDIHRTVIAKILGISNDIQVIGLLGNHETWSYPLLCSIALRKAGVNVPEDRVLKLGTLIFCVRGLGDCFTYQFRYIDFPNTCVDKIKIPLTQDPAAAFQSLTSEIILSAHTHCGQIRLTIRGAPHVPIFAPRAARCGFYQDVQRQLFISSGVGTSIIPIRFLAQA